MVPMEEEAAQQDNFNRFVMDEQYLKKEAVSDKTVKELQFAKPYFPVSYTHLSASPLRFWSSVR